MISKIMKNSIEEIKLPDLSTNEKISINDSNTLKGIYKKRKTYHKELYDLEKTINLVFDSQNNEVSFPFYSCLLIEDNIYIINYSYQWEAIKYVNKLHNNYKNNNIITILLAKIILVLIKNYINLENSNENIYKKYIVQIKEENQNIINENLEYLKDIGLNLKVKDLYDKKIDEILNDIIISLLNKNKDIENMSKLLEQLDFEFKDLPEEKIEKLFNNILKDENLLIDKNKLFDKKKINSYYFILKYILEKSFYISKIPLFSKTISNLVDLMKNDIFKLNIPDLDEDFKKRYEYVLETLLGKKYYENYLNTISKANININSTIVIENNKQNKKKEKKLKDKIRFEKKKPEKRKYHTEKDKEEDSRKIIETLFQIKIAKGQSSNTLRINGYLCQTRIINPDHPNLIFSVIYNKKTKEIIKIIDGS